jgi:hypothetical protein
MQSDGKLPADVLIALTRHIVVGALFVVSGRHTKDVEGIKTSGHMFDGGAVNPFELMMN